MNMEQYTKHAARASQVERQVGKKVFAGKEEREIKGGYE